MRHIFSTSYQCNECNCSLNGLDDDLPIFSGSYIPVGLRKSRTGDFMFRYLRTLVAWQEAVHLLFQVVIGSRFDILSSLRVSCITLTTHNKSDDRSSLLDSTKRVFENNKIDVDECQAAQSWIDKQLKRDLAPAQVHAEAGLMALIYDVYQGRVDSNNSKSYVCALKVCFHNNFYVIQLFEIVVAPGSRHICKPLTDWRNQKMLRTMLPTS